MLIFEIISNAISFVLKKEQSIFIFREIDNEIDYDYVCKKVSKLTKF